MTGQLDLTAKGFSLANARELALYARMAYDEPPTIRSDATDTNILITELPEAIIVSCKGTASLRNFVTDAQAWRTYTLLGEVHAGFWKAWVSVEDLVFSRLFDLPGKPILWGGHSLGGALAAIGARRSRMKLLDVHSVYLYGCPRIGDKTFRDEYNSTPMRSAFETLGASTFTVIDDCDIVPRLPGWLAGYRRPGHDEFISSTNPQDIAEDPSLFYRGMSDAIALFNGWRACGNALFLDELLRDHHIDNYIAALNAIEPRVALSMEDGKPA